MSNRLKINVHIGAWLYLVNPKLVHPKDYDQTVQIDLGKEFKNRYILFYAAKKNKSTDCEKIKTASEAYDKFNNRGMTKTNSKGIANLKLKLLKSQNLMSFKK